MSADSTETTDRADAAPAFRNARPEPGLLLAFGAVAAAARDRLAIGEELTLGRSGRVTWSIPDTMLSGAHARVRPFGSTWIIEDLGSSNGTFVQGVRVGAPSSIAHGSVIRAGDCVFVLHRDLNELEPLALPEAMAGRFHTPATLRALDVASATGRHVLLAGESGTGKELCAQRFTARVGGPIVTHNCARFASPEEAETTLFGVSRGVFSGVDARPGLLERADGGVLFLDELHVLPVRIQQSLLRFAEDGIHCRIGASESHRLSVRLVLATNAPLDSPAFAPDLLARLFVVELPPLEARRADIPEIFSRALDNETTRAGFDAASLRAELRADHFEALCLGSYTGKNVRVLEEIAAELAAELRTSGHDAATVVQRVFGHRFAGSAVVVRARSGESDGDSHYEQNRERIVATFEATQRNLSETERLLKAAGLRVSRRWLAVFLRRWGLRA